MELPHGPSQSHQLGRVMGSRHGSMAEHHVRPKQRPACGWGHLRCGVTAAASLLLGCTIFPYHRFETSQRLLNMFHQQDCIRRAVLGTKQQIRHSAGCRSRASPKLPITNRNTPLTGARERDKELHFLLLFYQGPIGSRTCICSKNMGSTTSASDTMQRQGATQCVHS